jgi:threonine/homoserine/homoserine lactone efflux protein
VFLGLQALWRVLRSHEGSSGMRDGRARARMAPAAAVRQGLLSNLGNPKMLAFFTSLLPQFGDSFQSLLGLGFLFCSLTLVWLSAYAVAVARAGDVLRRPRFRRAVEGLTGTVLIALGLRLATERR